MEGTQAKGTPTWQVYLPGVLPLQSNPGSSSYLHQIISWAPGGPVIFLHQMPQDSYQAKQEKTVSWVNEMKVDKPSISSSSRCSCRRNFNIGRLIPDSCISCVRILQRPALRRQLFARVLPGPLPVYTALPASISVRSPVSLPGVAGTF